ncbi:hypothetical protein QYM36_001258 [Artemia franciscana]|uniref:C2H2-type domain-containing protein n=1 Tax=Artemia franciscana TaxID=6661 RepID=A0AA88I8U7_ARTSF|nr:hypothetical protein QYM36_001258 [Artemia franciscana]KAK2724703.1 hypothetical protein QYM36_001258 [Artemia franciscana]
MAEQIPSFEFVAIKQEIKAEEEIFRTTDSTSSLDREDPKTTFSFSLVEVKEDPELAQIANNDEEPEDEIEAYTNDFVETTNPMLLPKLEDASAAALFCSSVHLALNRDFQKNGSTIDGDKESEEEILAYTNSPIESKNPALLLHLEDAPIATLPFAHIPIKLDPDFQIENSSENNDKGHLVASSVHDDPLRDLETSGPSNRANVDGEKPYQCEICFKCFSQKSYLKKHCIIHATDKPYICEICKATFYRKSHLVVHQRSHTGEKPYQCEICGKGFSFKSYVAVHQRSHTGEKPYQCEICSKDFSMKQQLAVHKRIHTGEKPYHCHLCGKSFSQKSHLNIHKRIHSGEKPHHCNICGKSFSERTVLRKHQRIHTGEKPHHCKVCGKSFSDQSYFIVHQRGHSGDKPYKCDVCGKTFPNKQGLNIHMRIHTGEKPYACLICSKSFAQKPHLKIHKRVHFGEKAELSVTS